MLLLDGISPEDDNNGEDDLLEYATKYDVNNFKKYNNWWDIYCLSDIDNISNEEATQVLFGSSENYDKNYKYNIQNEICLPKLGQTINNITINDEQNYIDNIDKNSDFRKGPSSYYRRFREMRWENQDNLPLFYKNKTNEMGSKICLDSNKNEVDLKTQIGCYENNILTDTSETDCVGEDKIWKSEEYLCKEDPGNIWTSKEDKSTEGSGSTSNSLTFDKMIPFGSKVNIMNNLQNHGLNECIRPISPPKTINKDSMYYLPSYTNNDDLLFNNEFSSENLKEIRRNVVQWAGLQSNPSSPTFDEIDDSGQRIVSKQDIFQSSAGSFDAYATTCRKHELDSKISPNMMKNKCHPGWDGSDMINKIGFKNIESGNSTNEIYPKNKEKDGSFTKGRGLNLSYSSRTGLDEDEQKYYQKHENMNMENDQSINFSLRNRNNGVIIDDLFYFDFNYNFNLNNYHNNTNPETHKYYDYYPSFNRYIEPDVLNKDNWSLGFNSTDPKEYIPPYFLNYSQNYYHPIFNDKYDKNGHNGKPSQRTLLNKEFNDKTIKDYVLYDVYPHKPSGNYYIGDYNLLLGGGEHPGWTSKNNWNRNPWKTIPKDNSAQWLEININDNIKNIKNNYIDNPFTDTNASFFYENRPKCVTKSDYIDNNNIYDEENSKICESVNKKYMYRNDYFNFKQDCENQTGHSAKHTSIDSPPSLLINKQQQSRSPEEQKDRDMNPMHRSQSDTNNGKNPDGGGTLDDGGGTINNNNPCIFIPHNYKGMYTNTGNKENEYVDDNHPLKQTRFSSKTGYIGANPNISKLEKHI